MNSELVLGVGVVFATLGLGWKISSEGRPPEKRLTVKQWATELWDAFKYAIVLVPIIDFLFLRHMHR